MTGHEGLEGLISSVGGKLTVLLGIGMAVASWLQNIPPGIIAGIALATATWVVNALFRLLTFLRESRLRQLEHDSLMQVLDNLKRRSNDSKLRVRESDFAGLGDPADGRRA